MENASKALIMAAGILIGVLILSLALYLYITFSESVNNTRATITTQQLSQFNSEYTVFTGRKNITIYEIISIANKAHENNERYKDYSNFEENYEIKVHLLQPVYSNLQQKNSDETLELLNEFTEIDENKVTSSEGTFFKNTFTCTGITYHEETTGRVSSITFKKTI